MPCRSLHASQQCTTDGYYTNKERQLHGIAFSELVVFIEQTTISNRKSIPVFKLSELNKIYCKRLEELGMVVTTRIHSTRLKNRILSQFEDFEAYTDGREVLLASKCDIGEVLTSASRVNYDHEGFVLAKAAQIIRR